MAQNPLLGELDQSESFSLTISTRFTQSYAGKGSWRSNPFVLVCWEMAACLLLSVILSDECTLYVLRRDIALSVFVSIEFSRLIHALLLLRL